MLKPKIKEKSWNPKIEEEIIRIWKKEKIYDFNKKTKKKIFTIDTPPPYPSGTWHIGASAHYSQIDMIARTMRMKGYEVLFPCGIDRNGLPVEVYTEKKYKIKLHEVPREKFIQLCSTALDELEKEMLKVMERSGIGYSNFYYRTDWPSYRKITQATFIELWKKGLIYEDERPTNYCPVCRTTIADAEIEYKEMETKLVYLKFKVKETNEDVVIATTRPELLCACACVIFNPSDSRYKELEGKHLIVPIYENVVEVRSHEYAKPEFGTGLVMICSYGDYSDVRLFRELKLKPIYAINEKGEMTDVSGKYKGMKVEQAREKIISDLKEMGLIEKEEKIMHRTPICWRSKNPIEFVNMKEFYLKQIEFLDELRKIVDKIKFHPPESKQYLIDWMNSITIDWPISRRRYYGTEIPIWYCKNCKEVFLPKPGNYYQPWKEKPPIKRCKCGSNEFVGETRTFDTWFDSSISELVVCGYMRDDELFKRTFPCSIRPQGKEIVRTWLYYTLLRAYQLFKKPAFKYVWISGLGVDEKGQKMSKSLGNIVLPQPVLDKYGGDALRLWSVSEASLGSDFRYNEERVNGAFKFLTKFWNVARFISCFKNCKKPKKMKKSDEWIIAELNEVIEKCLNGYNELDFSIPAQAIRGFVWNLFAPHYIEMVKSRAYEGDKSAIYTLHFCLEILLRLFAPICPFITDKIYRELYNKSVHHERLPGKIKVSKQLINFTEKIVTLNSSVWKYKKEKGMALNEKLDEFDAPKELEIFKDDLRQMHNIKKLNFVL
ncbi:MAG: valine--tRNA ligase [Candidatus Parvarchaeota archaeon]|nr:valine--tRNA ligase [Candidatus Jingweiarchaeum tengchongense]MCW1300079.1 valine--tRNA ligase [Candidatus Jingweiarchaeum tengchongense]MCW1304433.1 valine--tRNA ligase [Candidatus Jingweiarchaeum tengchongense]MCW1305600.1 valine--tRNA ligase [Candidatus Jingweiarchaeum tengchongense]MCW1310981.1 valine--tRNA ligase [Candidatus Jingweiarchaeum tengchongense]